MTSPSGLTESEAQARLASDGPNTLSSDVARSWFATFVAVLKEPMLLLLVVGGVLYVVFGELHEGLVLLVAVFAVIGITLYQERKTDRALAALRDLSSPRASVVRDGQKRRIPGHEVVRGDLVMLAEGDRIPADGTLIEAINLEVDESLLTGESVSVRKVASATTDGTPTIGGDDTPFVFSGTLVVKGHAQAIVQQIGTRTELGKIGKSLAAVVEEPSPLQLEVKRVVKWVALSAVVPCVLLVVVYGLVHGQWKQGLFSALALAMALIPEELPVVLMIFPALGAWRLSKEHVLTRRPSVIETMGATTVLCTDKTGTLTENRMRVAKLVAPEVTWSVDDKPLPEAVHTIVEYGILASQRDPFDPMELAFHQIGDAKLAGTEHLHSTWELVREYPLAPPLLSISHVWREPKGTRYVVAAKGAPETIVDLCHLPADRIAAVRADVLRLAAEGLRVMAVARAPFPQGPLPENQHDFPFELLGLVGLADPLRAEVPDAVRECKAAGIRVVLLTGDYPETARAIADAAGLSTTLITTGAEVDAMDEAALAARVGESDIFARVVPNQKLRILTALKARGEIVAMTGDGVNDAPALKAAHIGVAMGERGTDVAREAAALVLTRDNFASLVAAVRFGRRTYANLKRAVTYILAVHVPIIGVAVVPALMNWPPVLFPVHIVLFELLIDPACSIAFEAEPTAPGTMQKPPRSTSERMFDRFTLLQAVVQGAVVFAAVIGTYAWFLPKGTDSARALAFSVLIAANVGLILVSRSWETSSLGSLRARNVPAWVVMGCASVFLVILLLVPQLRSLMHFDAVGLLPFLASAGVGLASALWFDLVKGRFARWRGHAPRPAKDARPQPAPSSTMGSVK